VRVTTASAPSELEAVSSLKEEQRKFLEGKLVSTLSSWLV